MHKTLIATFVILFYSCGDDNSTNPDPGPDYYSSAPFIRGSSHRLIDGSEKAIWHKVSCFDKFVCMTPFAACL